MRAEVRNMCGVLILGMALAGCVFPGESVTEPPSFAAAEPRIDTAPVDPMDLPVDQRLPLFDPCTEIPEPVLNSIGFGKDYIDPIFPDDMPDDVKACEWENGDISFGVAAGWINREIFTAKYGLSTFEVFEASGNPASKFPGVNGDIRGECNVVLFTRRGTILVTSFNADVFGLFQGGESTPPCDILRYHYDAVAPVLPRGEF